MLFSIGPYGNIIPAGLPNSTEQVQLPKRYNRQRGTFCMKLVAFDLDDTLLNSKGTVSQRNRQALLACSQKGMKVGYITGRSPRKMEAFLQGLPCDFIANYNGAGICADNRLIEENVIDYTNAMDYLNKVTELAPDIGICAYFEPYCYKYNQIRSHIAQEVLEYDLRTAPQHNFQRIRLFLQGYENVDFSEHITGEMKYETSENSVIITHKRADKGIAFETILRYFGIEREQTISFGDSMADIPMLAASGIGVAVGNACPLVKAAAQYTTLSNEEDGVADFLEKHVL
jgi:5-amino-6-(5-phospho-D-ribitylamino)uracil phosphatase